MSKRNELIEELIRSYGSAVRMDWHDFDGRSCRDDMDSIADLFHQKKLPTREQAFDLIHVCDKTGGWIRHLKWDGQKCCDRHNPLPKEDE